MESGASQRKGVEALRYMAHALLSFIDEHQDFLFQFTGEQPALMRTKTGESLRARYVLHLDGIEKYVRQAIRMKQLRKHDPATGSIAFSFMVRMFMIDKVVRGKSAPLSSRTSELMDLFINGFGK